MNFYLGLATCLLLLVGTASAQHVNFGVKGGVNLYNIQNDNDVKYDTKVDFHIGMLFHIHVNTHFAIQPEILYSRQGAKFNTGNDKVNLKLEYANFPLMFQYMFNNGFRLEAGPQVGFLTKAKSELNGNESDIKSNIETVDFAIGAGIGYINHSSGWGVDARYNHGLSNINLNGPYKSYNRGFQIGALYQFQHK